MKVLMIILSALWAVAVAGSMFLVHEFMQHPAGGDTVAAMQAADAVSVVFRWLWYVGLPVLIVGWFVVALRRHAKPATDDRQLTISGNLPPGVYVRDRSTGNLTKVGK